MSALRWLYRTDGALIGIATAVWLVNALLAGEWLLAVGFAVATAWFALHVFSPRPVFEVRMPDGTPLARVTIPRSGGVHTVNLTDVRPPRGWRP